MTASSQLGRSKVPVVVIVVVAAAAVSCCLLTAVSALVAPAGYGDLSSCRNGAIVRTILSSSTSSSRTISLTARKPPSGSGRGIDRVRLHSQNNNNNNSSNNNDRVPYYDDPSYGRFRKSDDGNLFGNGPAGGGGRNPYNNRRRDEDEGEEEREDEASYRLARDLAARRGMNVFDSTPTMGSRGRGREGGGNGDDDDAGAESIRLKPPSPRQPVGASGRYDNTNARGAVGSNGGGSNAGTSPSSPTSFGSYALDDAFGAGYGDDRDGNDDGYGSSQSAPSQPFRDDGRGGNLYEATIKREGDSSQSRRGGVDDVRKGRRQEGPPPSFPPPLSGIKDTIAEASRNMFYKSKLGGGNGGNGGNGVADAMGRGGATTGDGFGNAPRNAGPTDRARRGVDASSRNDFRNINNNNSDKGVGGSYDILQRNHDRQRIETDRQQRDQRRTRPSSASSSILNDGGNFPSSTSYPFDRNSLSQLASSEEERRRGTDPIPPPPPPNVGAGRPPPPPPPLQRPGYAAGSRTPNAPPSPPATTRGDRMPPGQQRTPPQQQQQRGQQTRRTSPRQPPPPQQRPQQPVRPPPDYNYGRNAYKASVPLRPLSPPLSEIASSMPPPYEIAQGTMGERGRTQGGYQQPMGSQQQRQQQQQQQQQRAATQQQGPGGQAAQRPARPQQQQQQPSRGSDPYRPPPPPNIYPPPYQPQGGRAYAPPPQEAEYDPLRSRPPSPYGASRSASQRQQQSPGRPPPPPAARPRQQQMPLSQRAMRPDAEPYDRGGQMDSSGFRQSYSQTMQGNAGTVVGSFDRRQEVNPDGGYPQHLKQPSSASTESSTSSFKPPPFQQISQSDFRQPYQGEELPPQRDDGALESAASFGSDPFSGDQSFEGGPSPGYDRPPPFGDAMFLSPFAVPPMMMAMPPPMAGGAPSSREQQPRKSPSSQQPGVKVPKDPFVERQLRQRQQSPSSPSKSRSNSNIKIPKDPFVERQKRQQQQQQEQQRRPQWQPQPDPNVQKRSFERQEDRQVKVPKDPFSARQQQQRRRWENRPSEPPPPRQPTMQSNYGNEDLKIPKDPFAKRPQQQSEWASAYQSPPPSRERFSPVGSDGSDNRRNRDDDLKLPRDPFAERQQRQNQRENMYGRPPPPQRISPPRPPSPDGNNGNIRRNDIGSTSNVGENDNMTYEEYSSYFDAP